MVWLLLMAICVVGSNALLFSPIAVEIAGSFGITEASDVLLASAVYGAATALSALILAPYADRFGLARALLAALGLLSLAMVLSAFAPSLFVLCVAQALAGIAAGVGLPSIYGLAAEIAPKGEESSTLGKVLIGWTLSLVFGVSLSAFIADLVHWRAVFGFLAVLTGIIFLIVGSKLPSADRHNAPSTAHSPLRAARLPGAALLLFAVAGYMAAFYGLYAYLGTHLQILGQSTSATGLAALFYGIGFAVAAPFDRWLDRAEPMRTAIITLSGLAATYVLVALSTHSALTLYWLCGVWGLVNHLGMNVLVARLTSLQPSMRASLMGLYSFVTYVSMFLGTLIYQRIFEDAGFAIAALLSASLALLAMAMAAIAALRKHPGHAALP